MIYDKMALGRDAYKQASKLFSQVNASFNFVSSNVNQLIRDTDIFVIIYDFRYKVLNILKHYHQYLITSY